VYILSLVLILIKPLMSLTLLKNRIINI